MKLRNCMFATRTYWEWKCTVHIITAWGIQQSSPFPVPNLPKEPLPQEYTSPLRPTMTTWPVPHATADTSTVSRDSTSFGAERDCQSPWPKHPMIIKIELKFSLSSSFNHITIETMKWSKNVYQMCHHHMSSKSHYHLRKPKTLLQQLYVKLILPMCLKKLLIYIIDLGIILRFLNWNAKKEWYL